MQNPMNRTLTILADGELITGYARARLLGTEWMGLYNDTEEELLNLLTEVYEGLRELCDRIENVIAKG